MTHIVTHTGQVRNINKAADLSEESPIRKPCSVLSKLTSQISSTSYCSCTPVCSNSSRNDSRLSLPSEIMFGSIKPTCYGTVATEITDTSKVTDTDQASGTNEVAFTEVQGIKKADKVPPLRRVSFSDEVLVVTSNSFNTGSSSSITSNLLNDDSLLDDDYWISSSCCLNYSDTSNTTYTCNTDLLSVEDFPSDDSLEGIQTTDIGINIKTDSVAVATILQKPNILSDDRVAG